MIRTTENVNFSLSDEKDLSDFVGNIESWTYYIHFEKDINQNVYYVKFSENSKFHIIKFLDLEDAGVYFLRYHHKYPIFEEVQK